MTSVLTILYMSVWRRIREITRYKLNFILDFAMSFIWGIGLMIFVVVIDPAKLGGTIGSSNYFIFMLVGIAFQTFQGASIWGPLELKDELTKGQIEYTFASPVSRYLYVFSNSFSEAVVGAIFGLIPMFAIAFIFLGTAPSPHTILMVCIAILLTLLALCQIGVIMSSAILIFKDVSAVMSVLNFLFQIATGMFVPVQLMPEPLKILAFLIPMTHGMDLARHFIMGSKTIWPIDVEFCMLILLLVVFGLLARAANSYLERKAKREGLALA